MSYTKLDSGITESTIWQAPDSTLRVWIAMLARADQNGHVGASVPGLASLARVSMEACIAALELLSAPDKWSRTKDHDGRRIVEADGGWVLLNHAKYRAKQTADDRRERSRVAMANLRSRRKDAAAENHQDNSELQASQQDNNVSKSLTCSSKLTQAEAEAEAEAKETSPIPPSGAESSTASTASTPSTPAQTKPHGKPAVGLKAWIEAEKAAGRKLIPADDPVFAYAQQSGIPSEFLTLAWSEFRQRYTAPDAKRYRDWRAVFRNAVRANWLKLWFLDPASGQYGLTTVGLQAQRVHQQPPRAA